MNYKEIMNELNERELSDLFLRINKIDIEEIVDIYHEIKDNGTFHNGDYDCLQEFSVSDIEWGCGEKDGGIIINICDMYEHTWELLSNESLKILKKAQENDVMSIYIDIEYI